MKFAIRAWIFSLAVAAGVAGQSAGAEYPDDSVLPATHSRMAVSRLADEPAPGDDKILSSPEPIAEGPVTDGEWEGMSGSCCDDGCCISPFQRGRWYGSVDYLLFRPRFSQAVTEVRRTLVTDTENNTSTLIDQAIEGSFDYQSGFRAALGYRLLDCGGDIQVQYWRMNASDSAASGPANTVANNPFIAGQLKNNPGNGGTLTTNYGVTANIFDVDFAKCLSFGGPCEPCDPCFCPRWDLRYWAGARIADISRYDNNIATSPQSTVGPNTTYGDINARFVGAGPRVGAQGRRYFGQTGCLSVYARASQALLIGDYRMSRVKTTPGSANFPTEVTSQYDQYSRMIPVTDIEIGGSWQVAPFTFVSVGYFFQCWWDLGWSETVIGTNFGPLDTSNIMGFDGLFVRGEMLF